MIRRVIYTGLMCASVGLIAGCASDGGQADAGAASQSARTVQAPPARDEALADRAAARATEQAEAATRERAARREAEVAEREARVAAQAVEAERQAAIATAEREAEIQAELQAALAAEQRAEAERIAAAEQAEAEARAAAERQAAQQAAQARAAAEAQAAAAAEEAERQAAAAAAAAAAEAERMAAEQRAEAEAEQAAAAAAAERLAAERLATEQRAAAERAAQAQQRATAAASDKSESFNDIDESAGNVDFSQFAPTSAEIARLGNDLTPWGAVQGANAEGTIPAWTGGITAPPAGYSPGDHHPDPFAGDAPRLTLTASNYQQYADQLTAGHQAMFARYSDYQMPVYPTRRSASFSQRAYDMAIQNASTARLTPDGEGVINAAESIPFPIPKTARHLIWNHKMKPKGVNLLRYNNQVAPTTGGSYTVIKLREELLGLYWQPGNTIDDINNVLTYFFQKVESPARLAGNVLLVHETLNQEQQQRQAWIYNPGQRRVRRAPNVAYDNPGTASDGLRTNDMTDMFNGALDRYNWRLIGKREMIVPYNAYKLHADTVDYDDLVRPGYLNTALTRYELHRVWVVEATLKDGQRHIHPRRTFYLDEDSYQIVAIDHYDNRGELWRLSEGHSINYYDQPLFWATMESHMDLLSGRYLVVGIDNQEPMVDFSFSLNPGDFTPASLRTRGVR